MPNKTVLITGASRGIGRATAIRFAQDGFNLCINYLKNTVKAEQLATELMLNFKNIKVTTFKADVSKEIEVVALFQHIDQEFEQLDVLINNAGIIKPQASILEMDETRINDILTTNVTSCFLCCREAIKRMKPARRGAIVNVSSIAARIGAPNEYIDYAASKGAIDTLTRGLSLEVAADNIRVNAVSPGIIYTDIHADGGEPGRVDRLKEYIPLKRGGQPEEVAEAIYWLASDSSSFVTGTNIDVGGGR